MLLLIFIFKECLFLRLQEAGSGCTFKLWEVGSVGIGNLHQWEVGVMNIGEVCMRTVVFTRPDSTILEAAQLMRNSHVGDLIVMEESGMHSVPVGIVTDRDIVLAVVAKNVSPETVTIGDIMCTELVVAKEEDSIWETLQRMRRKGVRRIPVVNEREGLVGIFTLDDMLDLLADEMKELAALIRREQEHEREARV